MAFKYIIVATLLAATNAGFIAGPAASSYISNSLSHGAALSYTGPSISYATPVPQYSYGAPATYTTSVHNIAADQHAPAHYSFENSAQNSQTGGSSNQNEARQGDAVRGSYPLLEVDGSRRTVGDTADEHRGLNSVVHRESSAHPDAFHTHTAPLTHYSFAPIAHYSTAPAVYAAPTQVHFHH